MKLLYGRFYMIKMHPQVTGHLLILSWIITRTQIYFSGLILSYNLVICTYFIIILENKTDILRIYSLNKYSKKYQKNTYVNLKSQIEELWDELDRRLEETRPKSRKDLKKRGKKSIPKYC